jgi:hypothetical protein
MLASYYLVYVITPFDITWHVSTSIDRLLVQLWPLVVLTAFGGSGGALVVLSKRIPRFSPLDRHGNSII